MTVTLNHSSDLSMQKEWLCLVIFFIDRSLRKLTTTYMYPAPPTVLIAKVNFMGTLTAPATGVV